MEPDVYIAGLWKMAFAEGLLWSPLRYQNTRPKDYRAPSWSWASVDGRLTYHRYINSPGTTLRLAERNIELHDQVLEYGEVVSTYEMT